MTLAIMEERRMRSSRDTKPRSGADDVDVSNALITSGGSLFLESALFSADDTGVVVGGLYVGVMTLVGSGVILGYVDEIMVGLVIGIFVVVVASICIFIFCGIGSDLSSVHASAVIAIARRLSM